MEILIKARSRCHKDHHKGKKEAFSVVIREARIFPNYCMENGEICLLRLARSISVVLGLIYLCIERRSVLLLYNHMGMKVKHCHECNFCSFCLSIYQAPSQKEACKTVNMNLISNRNAHLATFMYYSFATSL